MAAPLVQTRSDEDSAGRCPPVSLVSGSVPLGFNHSVKIQILLSTVGINLPSLLARRCKGLMRYAQENQDVGLH